MGTVSENLSIFNQHPDRCPVSVLISHIRTPREKNGDRFRKSFNFQSAPRPTVRFQFSFPISGPLVKKMGIVSEKSFNFQSAPGPTSGFSSHFPYPKVPRKIWGMFSSPPDLPSDYLLSSAFIRTSHPHVTGFFPSPVKHQMTGYSGASSGASPMPSVR